MSNDAPDEAPSLERELEALERELEALERESVRDAMAEVARPAGESYEVSVKETAESIRAKIESTRAKRDSTRAKLRDARSSRVTPDGPVAWTGPAGGGATERKKPRPQDEWDRRWSSHLETLPQHEQRVLIRIVDLLNEERGLLTLSALLKKDVQKILNESTAKKILPGAQTAQLLYNKRSGCPRGYGLTTWGADED
jgi:hypothetical protein